MVESDLPILREIKYFKEAEFQKAQPSCSMSQMDLSFLERLDKARELAGIPFVINSAYRSKEYERENGRDGTSAHCFGLAVDIRAVSSQSRMKVLRGCIQAGFNRIGIGATFIHVDDSWFHPQDVCWLYKE